MWNFQGYDMDMTISINDKDMTIFYGQAKLPIVFCRNVFSVWDKKIFVYSISFVIECNIESIYYYYCIETRDRLQISLLILTEFKRIDSKDDRT